MPPLPLPSITPIGSGTPSKVEILLSHALKLPASLAIQALIEKIHNLGPNATIKDIQEWAKQAIDSGQLNLTPQQLYQFTALTGTRIPEHSPLALEDFKQRIKDWKDNGTPGEKNLANYISQYWIATNPNATLSDVVNFINNNASKVPDFYVTSFDPKSGTTISPEDLAALFSMAGLSSIPAAPTDMDNALLEASREYVKQTDPVAQRFLADYMAALQGQTSVLSIQNFLKNQISNNFSAYPQLSPALKIMTATWAQLPPSGNFFNYPQAAISDFSTFLPQIDAQAKAWRDTLDPDSQAFHLADALINYLEGTPPPSSFTTFNQWIANNVMHNQPDLLAIYPSLSVAEANVFLNLIEPDGHLAYVNPQNRPLTAQRNSAEGLYQSYQNNYAYQVNLMRLYAQQATSGIDQAQAFLTIPGINLFTFAVAGHSQTLWQEYTPDKTMKPPPPYPEDREGWANLKGFLDNVTAALKAIVTGSADVSPEMASSSSRLGNRRFIDH